MSSAWNFLHEKYIFDRERVLVGIKAKKPETKIEIDNSHNAAQIHHPQVFNRRLIFSGVLVLSSSAAAAGKITFYSFFPRSIVAAYVKMKTYLINCPDSS